MVSNVIGIQLNNNNMLMMIIVHSLSCYFMSPVGGKHEDAL
jgi:type III secretory pathway component EscR